MALPDALQRYLSRHWGDRAEALWGLALSGPAMLLMLVLLIGPLLAITLLSFSDWQLGMPTMGWVGVDNYRQLAADDVFWQAVRNTAVYVLVVMVGAVGLGLLLALLIEGCTRGKAIYRTLFFLPVMASLVAMTIVWEFLLHPEFGLINQLLMMLGGEPRSWLRDEDWALVALCVIGIWHQAGFNMVLFMAGLTAVPRTLYEAADMDGIPRGFSHSGLFDPPLDVIEDHRAWRVGGDRVAEVFLEGVVREFQTLLGAVGPEIAVHAAMDGFAVLIKTGTPAVVPEAVPVALLFKTDFLGNVDTLVSGRLKGV